MKVRFDHTYGVWVENASLLEVVAEREWESHKFMFENGWLPYRGEWYQTRSSRVKTGEISKKRKKTLQSIEISDAGDIEKFIKQAEGNGKFILEEFEYFIENHDPIVFFMDDALLGVCNRFDDQIMYSVMAYDKAKNGSKSYGTNSFYYLIDRFKDDYEYIYISEYYPEFEYKSDLQGFEYWDGSGWVSSIK